MGFMDKVFQSVTSGIQNVVTIGVQSVSRGETLDNEGVSSGSRLNMPNSKQAWEKTEYSSVNGERQDSWPEDPNAAEENARTKKEFHVYLNMYGKYQMEDGYRNACEDVGMTPDEIQDKYADTMHDLRRKTPNADMLARSAYADIAMWERAHDPVYLSSLDSEGLGMFMEKYSEWEAEHVMPPMYEGEEPRVIFGATIEKYAGMTAEERELVDATSAQCMVEWGKFFDDGMIYLDPIEQESTGPDESVEAEGKSSGFWANLKEQASNAMTAVREVLESTTVGAWVVNTYDSVKDAASSLFEKAEEKVSDLKDAYGKATEETEYEGDLNPELLEITKGDGSAKGAPTPEKHQSGVGKNKYDPSDFPNLEESDGVKEVALGE